MFGIFLDGVLGETGHDGALGTDSPFPPNTHSSLASTSIVGHAFPPCVVVATLTWIVLEVNHVLIDHFSTSWGKWRTFAPLQLINGRQSNSYTPAQIVSLLQFSKTRKDLFVPLGTPPRNKPPPMLPTPDTSHVAFERVYEPSEDSYLLLDTLSSESETTFLRSRFGGSSSSVDAGTPTPAGTIPAPFVVEIGPGSGVVVGFVNAHATHIFGTSSVLTAAIDVNRYACVATGETARKAAANNVTSPSLSSSTTSTSSKSGFFLDAMQGDLTAPLRDGSVDVLIFNPPYVPTAELPRQPTATDMVTSETVPTFQDDSYLLSLSYAGGADGMEITDLLIGQLGEVLSLRRGCAYVLLCAQNKPEAVKARVRGFGPEWRAETVGSSGKQAGWEKLQIVRIWRESPQQ